MGDNQEKDFFDKVGDVASDVADTIVKASSDLYQKGKKQVELTKMRSDQRELHKKLGAICYAMEKGYTADDAAKAELIAQLDELNERIEQIEAERAADRQAKAEKAAAKEAEKASQNAAQGPIEIRFDSETCSVCGEGRVGKLPYCGYCGAKFEE